MCSNSTNQCLSRYNACGSCPGPSGCNAAGGGASSGSHGNNQHVQISRNTKEALDTKVCTIEIYIDGSLHPDGKLLIFVYTSNSKKVVFWIVVLCIAYCCIPRPQSTMAVTNF